MASKEKSTNSEKMNEAPHDWEKEVQATLELAESIQAAEPSPFFKERVLARLDIETEPMLKRNWLRRNRLAIAAAVLLLAVNAFTLLQYSSPEAPSQGAEGVEAIAEVYEMTLDSKY